MDAVDTNEAPKVVVQRILKHTTSEETLLSGLSQLLRAVVRGGTAGSEVLRCYLEESSECKEILRYLQWERQKQSGDGILLCFRLLEGILLFTASSGGHLHSAGSTLVQRLLQQGMRVVYAGLAGGPSNSAKLASTTLKLLTVMVAQNVGCAKDVLAVFDFSCKPLERLSVHQKGSKRKDSARQCFINFALSFLVVGDADVIHDILNLKGFLSSVLKHLHKDPEEVAVTVLTVVKEKAVQNPDISKRVKSVFFTRSVLESMAQFLIQGEENVVSLDDEQGGVPLSVMCFHLLMQLCTNFQTGVCYRSKWNQVTERRSNNPVLLSFIQSQTPHLSRPLVQHLIISTIAACPDLLLPYMGTLPFSLEPRLTSKWVNSVEFIVKLYSALPPVAQLHGHANPVAASDGARPHKDIAPGRSTALLGYCLPPPFSRSNLSVGIQNSSSLVKHLSLSVMVLSLQRVGAVLEATASHSSEGSMEKEAFRDCVLRSLPDMKTVIALHHNLLKGEEVGGRQAVAGGSELPPELQLRSEELSKGKTLLGQVLDVMNGYLTVSPMVFVHAGFDVGKLLTSSTAWPTSTTETDETTWKKLLVLLTNAPSGTLKWYHQGSNLLQSVVELVFHTEPTISQPAALLLQKILQECPLLEDLPAEVALFVSSLYQQAGHQLIAADDIVEIAGFLTAAFLQLTHSSTFQSNISAKVGVDLGTTDLERATKVVGVVPCVLMMGMLRVQKVTGLFLFGEILQRCLHRAASTGTMATTFLSLLESQEWLELVRGSHDRSVLRYQQLLVKYLSVWGSGATRVQDSPCGDEDCSPVGPLKKRLKKLKKAQKTTADISVSRVCVEILATSPNVLASELPSAHKWMVEQLPQTTVTAVDHFLTFCPSSLAPPGPNYEWEIAVPVSVVLKGKLLDWSLISGNDDGNPPQSKRGRHDQRGESGTSPSPFSPAGLLEEVLSDEAFQPQVIAAAKHVTTQTDLTHSVYILRSLLLIALKKIEDGAGEKALGVQAATTVVTLMRALFSKLNSLLVQDGTEAEGSGALSVEEGLSTLLDGVFSHSLVSVPFQLASVTPTEDTGLSSSGRKRRQKHLTVNAKHAGLLIAELLAFCARLWPPWRTSQAFQALLRQSMAGVEGQLTTSSCSIIKALFPLMEVEQTLNVIDTLVDLCVNSAGDIDRQKTIVNLLLAVLPKAEHTNDGGSCDGEDEKAAVEGAGVSSLGGGAKSPLCVSSSSLEKLIKAVSSEAAKPGTNCPLEAVLDAAFSALLSTSVSPSACSGRAAEPAVRNAAKSILKFLEQFDKASPTVRPPLLNQQSLSVIAFSHGLPTHPILGSVSEDALRAYFQRCLKWPSPCKVRTACLLFRHLPVLQSWLTSEEGVALLRDALSAAAQDSELGHLLPFVKAYLEVVSARGAANGKGICACLEEVTWGACNELFLQTRREEEKQVAGEVLILLVKGTQKKKLENTQKKLMKAVLAVREGGETVWARIHLEVLEVLIPLAAVNKPMLLFAAAAQIINDLHANLTTRSEPVASTASVEALLCSVGSQTLTHCQLCSKEGCIEFLLDPFGGRDKFVHVYNSLIKCILKSHFLSHVHLDFLCSFVIFVSCTKNSITGSDVITASIIMQMIWSHSRFLEVLLCNLEPDAPQATLQAKDALVRLLVAVLPAADLMPPHCPILLAAYQGTLSTTDRGILYMLNRYEASGVKLADFFPFMWGKPALEHYQSKQKLGWLLWKQPSMQEVLTCLRREQLFQSVTLFPLDKSLEPTNPYDNGFSGNYKDSAIYDPSFLLPFLGYHLRPGAIVECRRFVESGCWSYLLAALASSCAEVRAASYHCLIQFRGHLEGARFREKSQVVVLMAVLQNSIAEENQQLSSVHSQLFSKLSQLFLKPDNELYPILCNLVVYRPVLDLSTVPFVNLLFYSSSPVAKSERSWMLKILVDGLRTEEEYLLYYRHGVFTSAMAFWESAISDPQAKGLILQLLGVAVKLRAALVDLVKRRDLFGWIHRGLQSTRDHHHHLPQGRWKSLTQLACSTWEHWHRLTTDSTKDAPHIPYPHIMFQAALIVQDLQLLTPSTSHSTPGGRQSTPNI